MYEPRFLTTDDFFIAEFPTVIEEILTLDNLLPAANEDEFRLFIIFDWETKLLFTRWSLKRVVVKRELTEFVLITDVKSNYQY